MAGVTDRVREEALASCRAVRRILGTLYRFAATGWWGTDAGRFSLGITGLWMPLALMGTLFCTCQVRGAHAVLDVWTSHGPGGGTVETLAIDPLVSGTIYAGTLGGGSVFKSTDGGTTWNVSNTGLSQGAYVYALAIDPTVNSTLYAGGPSGVYKSTDGGSTWNGLRTGLALGASVYALVIDPSTSSTLYAGTDDGVLKTTDGGSIWAHAGPNQRDIRALAIDARMTSTVYAGTYGSGIFKSTNGGSSRDAVNTGLTAR